MGAWRALGAGSRVGAVTWVAAVVVVTAWWLQQTTWVLASGASVLVLAAAATVDAVEHRLPNVLVALGAVPLGVALVGVTIARGDLGALTAAATGAAVVGGPLLLTHLVTPAGMGFGDVKAGAVLGAALAPTALVLAPLALLLGLGTAGTWGLARRVRTVPLGPFLVSGALAALVVGRLVELEPR